VFLPPKVIEVLKTLIIITEQNLTTQHYINYIIILILLSQYNA